MPDGFAGLRALPSAGLDVAFASNIFEHLSGTELEETLSQIRRILVDRGRLIIMQPNFKYCMAEYFDDYTHVAIFTHVGLADLLRAKGFNILSCEGRFMPYSFKSLGARLSWLVPLYLWLPYKPMAAQMLVVAEKRPGEDL